ncbi:MAG: hypothetical protein ACYC1C_01955 [Chloroflexota bacterium]
MAVKKTPPKRTRSAVTGQFVPDEEAKKHPKTTVQETTKAPKKGRKSK